MLRFDFVRFSASLGSTSQNIIGGVFSYNKNNNIVKEIMCAWYFLSSDFCLMTIFAKGPKEENAHRINCFPVYVYFRD